MAFARRAFAYIKHHFTYEFPRKRLGIDGMSGRQVGLQRPVSLLRRRWRANAVPARMLPAEAKSQKPDDKLGGEI